jgi:hypothetical protein
MERVLVILAALLAWCLFVLVKPDKPCRKCGGWGSRKRRRRRSACGRCGGTGKRMRLSARIVHGGKTLAHERIREATEKRREARDARHMVR